VYLCVVENQHNGGNDKCDADENNGQKLVVMGYLFNHARFSLVYSDTFQKNPLIRKHHLGNAALALFPAWIIEQYASSNHNIFADYSIGISHAAAESRPAAYRNITKSFFNFKYINK
jgi:hypothetical protein